MKITKLRLKQIIKEELESILNEYGNISHVLGEGTPDKEQEWSEFVKNYTSRPGPNWWQFEKEGMKAIWVPGHQGDPRLSGNAISAAQAIDPKARITMHEGDLTIVTNIPAPAAASSLVPDRDGDVDNVDPDAVFDILRADLPRLKALYGTQWTVEKTMEEFGDSPVGVTIAGPAAEEAFKARLKWALHNKSPKTEEEAERGFDEVYEWAANKYESY